MKKMLKKLRRWVDWVFTNEQRVLEKPKPKSFDTNVHYFDATMFYNDLDNPEDYYLRVSPTEENRFVRKDEVDDN